MVDIVELARIHGVEKLRFHMSAVPLRSCGFITCTNINDVPVSAVFSINESRYKVADGYKIAFNEATSAEGYKLHQRAMHISYLENMINSGTVKVTVELEEVLA